MGPAYKEFGYNEHPAAASRFLCIKTIDCNVKKFRYNEHPLITSSFFFIFLLFVGGTRGKWFFFSSGFEVAYGSLFFLKENSAQAADGQISVSGRIPTDTDHDRAGQSHHVG